LIFRMDNLLPAMMFPPWVFTQGDYRLSSWLSSVTWLQIQGGPGWP